MKATIKKTQLKQGWLSGYRLRSSHQLQTVPATEPREFSCDPAFGDFNLPLTEGSLCVESRITTVDDDDVSYLRNAIEADDFEPYSDFRSGELGL